MEIADHHFSDEVVTSSPEVVREEALRRLKTRRDLQAHAVTYLVVNLVIWAVWVVIALGSGGWWPWPIFLTLAWGVGLALNAWDVLIRKPITEADLRREIERVQKAAS